MTPDRLTTSFSVVRLLILYQFKLISIIMAQKKFWMVYLEGQNPPKYKHGTYESALKEAKRLTQKHDLEAYILETIQTVKLDLFKIEDTIKPAPGEDSDLPF